jgi:hypothetical protein
MSQKLKPAHEIRLGRIRAAIWANQADNREVWFNVTVSRLYKDGEQWKDTTAFGRDDLPIVAKVADMAYAWIWGQEAVSSRGSAHGEHSDGQWRANRM